VATYDLQPEMSAYPVTDEVVKAVSSGKYNVIILNYANLDMVGHTGVFDAAVSAVELLIIASGGWKKQSAQAGGLLILTADHGNAEQMLDDSAAFRQRILVTLCLFFFAMRHAQECHTCRYSSDPA